jgi:murein DD-endopeptidase MepM/ murein hydrolase activator NlpD
MLVAVRQRTQRLLAPPLQGLRRIRTYDFRDCRLILEQDGNVHYLVLTASFQRRAATLALRAAAAFVTLLLLMATASTALSIANSRLQQSHENIYRALLETYGGAEGESDKLSEDQMLAIASSIRQRNSEIQRFVDRSLASISAENVELFSELRGSGLTEQAIRTIQLSTPIGGYADNVTPRSDLAQIDELAKTIAKNHSLRDVLAALPDHLPLDSPGISSTFGLRIHPITGKPQFHTGLDLIPTHDLLIHPALRGKVVLAARGQELGNVVVVRHGSGVETLYGHMASIAVHEGDQVNESTVLGIVGNTGSASTGRHLHFEVTVGGYPVNPLKVIQTAQNVRKIEARR